MISNIALPSSKIGSWTSYMDHFNSENFFFDFILSPNEKENGRYLTCKKRKWLTHLNFLRRFQLLNWVARDYLNEINRLGNLYPKITIVVFDDVVLLEAIAFKKHNFGCEVVLIFYFHGYELTLSKFVQDRLDKVLFLSTSSYLTSMQSSLQFTPEAVIVGNGIDSKSFFSIDVLQKNKLKQDLGFPVNSLVVSWMANNRPVKGLHLFLKIAEIILEKYPQLVIQIIGSNHIPTLNHPRIKQLGKVPHHSIPVLLQSSDFYFFTSLWKEGFGLSVVEAAKCGNWILSSKNGSIPEVLQGFEHVYYVDLPNIVYEWVEVFDRAIQDHIQAKDELIPHNYAHLHTYEEWQVNFTAAVG